MMLVGQVIKRDAWQGPWYFLQIVLTNQDKFGNKHWKNVIQTKIVKKIHSLP